MPEDWKKIKIYLFLNKSSVEPMWDIKEHYPKKQYKSEKRKDKFETNKKIKKKQKPGLHELLNKIGVRSGSPEG